MPMKHLNPYRLMSSGFTLIEMAIVLMIIGLLLGGILVPLNAQMNQRNNSDTQKSLSEIRDALIGYVLANGYLPCPANPTDVTGVTATAGIARTPPCTGTSATGVLPWATLGVSEIDAWGNRFTYRVTSDYADAISNATYGGCTPSPIPTQASFGLCSVGKLNVWSAGKATSVATNVVAVVISHGQNGAGAYTPQGVQLSRGSSPDELENSDGSADYDYISHLPTGSGTANGYFDDIVIWISPSILNSRMVSAGKLP